jgi:L-aspartate oxidase
MAASNWLVADPAAVALMIAVAALRREHSLGAHYRTDFPSAPAAPERSRLTLDDALAAAYALPVRIRRA